MLTRCEIDKVLFKYDISNHLDHNYMMLIATQLEQIREKFGAKAEIRSMLPPLESGGGCVVSYFKPTIDPRGMLYSCCLGAQPREKNSYCLGNLLDFISSGSRNPLTDCWLTSKPIRNTMMTGTKCKVCNYTDRSINQQFSEFKTY